MQRILDPGQIEASSSRTAPRLVLPDRGTLFAARAARLTALAAHDSLGGYLSLAAALCAAQQQALDALEIPAPDAAATAPARAHGMPPVPARGWRRGPEWASALDGIRAALAADRRFPPAVAAICAKLGAAGAAEREAWAERLLAADGRDADPAAAPIVIAALQVYWVGLAAGLAAGDIAVAEHCALCPVCGTAPVASIVRTQAPFAGQRYLRCGLCASEWHRVRIECTVCNATRGIAYQSIEGGSPAIRAETCDACHAYRKIFYQEHEPSVEPLADDLASVALDLLLGEAGFHRASPNPLLWQSGS